MLSNSYVLWTFSRHNNTSCWGYPLLFWHSGSGSDRRSKICIGSHFRANHWANQTAQISKIFLTKRRGRQKGSHFYWQYLPNSKQQGLRYPSLWRSHSGLNQVICQITVSQGCTGSLCNVNIINLPELYSLVTLNAQVAFNIINVKFNWGKTAVGCLYITVSCIKNSCHDYQITEVANTTVVQKVGKRFWSRTIGKVSLCQGFRLGAEPRGRGLKPGIYRPWIKICMPSRKQCLIYIWLLKISLRYVLLLQDEDKQYSLDWETV